MKNLTLFVCIFATTLLNAQTKITKTQIATAETLIDLQFTEVERDSLLEEAQNYLAAYQANHKIHIQNSVAPVFTFDPVPVGIKFAKKQVPVQWDIPENVPMPVNTTELAYYSIPQLASLIYYKKISSLTLTQFFLQRLKTYGDTLHCVISITEDIALQQARQADAELAKGKYRGLLHGIPYGVKDLLAVAGTKTTWGAVPYKDQQIETTATVVQKLQNAGAVLVAKLSMGALAMDDVWFGGLTRNPWDLKEGSSGSSAGSASATSAGLVPFSIGTETWGSIVAPSERCGTTGLRPTFGRVSRYGGMTLCWSLDKIGPITRSAEDAAVVFDAIRGADELDRSTRSMPFNYDGLADLHKLKIAYAKNYFDSLAKDRNEWKTLEAFKAMGAHLTPIEFKTTVPINIMNIILMSECAAAFDEFTRSNLDDLMTEQYKHSWPTQFRAARFIPAVEYINANRLRTQLIKEMDSLISPYDAILTPNLNFEGDGGQSAITNMSGHPVVVFPNGFTKEGKPTSIALIGNLYDEATILAIAKIFQDATDFNKKHPNMFKK